MSDLLGTLECKGKIISRITFENNHLCISFTDGTGISIWDDNQTCCEHRYMTTADDMAEHVKAALKGIELLNVDNVPVEEAEDYVDHEVQFLRIITSHGELVFSNHNEHNGCYSGFDIKVAVIQ